MAVKNYQWTAALTVESGGYSGELITIESNGTVLYSGSVASVPRTFNLPWTTTTNETGSATYTYTYRDSDSANNNNSTKVSLTVRDDWTVTIDNRNYMTVTVNTTLVSASRSRIGSPSNLDRHLWMRRSKNGRDYNPFPLIDNGSTNHTIASNVSLGSYTFTLAPGENAQRASIWWRNTTVGFESRPIPNQYTDILGVGIHFKNILPKDYVPGQTWNGTNWMSHNRTGGTANIYHNATWTQMRTYDGGVGTDNPPYIRHNDGTWRNQRLIGQDG